MFKKLKLLLIFLILPIFIISCSRNFSENIKSPLRISKPSLNFYTENLIRAIKNSKNVQVSIFYSKTGKNKIIPNDYMEKFNLFMDSIKPSYFVNANTAALNLRDPEYRLTIFIENKSSFIINIFSDKFITIHPWDGSYKPDIIDISYLHEGINIYNIVDFIIKNNTEK